MAEPKSTGARPATEPAVVKLVSDLAGSEVPAIVFAPVVTVTVYSVNDKKGSVGVNVAVLSALE